MPDAVTYIALTDQQLEDLAAKLKTHDTYMSLERVNTEFGFSETFVRTLVKEGKIKPYPVDGHAKVVRYKYSELKAVFLNT